jgi:programmed cell death protein 5
MTEGQANDLQQQLLERQKEQERLIQLELQLDAIARKALSPEARNRLNNVRLVDKEKYFRVIQQIILLFQKGELHEKLSEAQLKELLLRNQEKREFRIRRR